MACPLQFPAFMPDPSFPRYSVVYLTYNGVARIAARLGEVLDLILADGVNRPLIDNQEVETVVHDNGSSDDTRFILPEFDGRFAARQTTFRRIHTPTNMGFARGFNKAIATARGQFLCLLSDDVVLTGPGLLHALDVAFGDNPGVLVGHRVIDWGAGWNQFGSHPPIAYLDGYFLACTAGTWARLGGFDERYEPHDFEDLDISMKARSIGIPVVADPSLPLAHLGAQTIGQSTARYDNTVRQRARFAEKWGLINQPERP